MIRLVPRSTLFPYTTLFRSVSRCLFLFGQESCDSGMFGDIAQPAANAATAPRSEEHTSELQSHSDLVCRLLLEKKKLEAVHGGGVLLALAANLCWRVVLSFP